MENWHYMEKHFYIYKHIVLAVQIIDDLYLIIPLYFQRIFPFLHQLFQEHRHVVSSILCAYVDKES